MTTRNTGRRTPTTDPKAGPPGSGTATRVLRATAELLRSIEWMIAAAIARHDPTVPSCEGSEPVLLPPLGSDLPDLPALPALPRPALPTLGHRRTVSIAAMALVPLSMIAMPTGAGKGSSGGGLTPAASTVRGAADATTGQPAPSDGGDTALDSDRGGPAARMADRRAVVPELALDDFGPLEREAAAPEGPLRPAKASDPVVEPESEAEPLPEPEEGFPEEYVERVAALADVHGFAYGETIGEDHVRRIADAYGREIGEEVEEVDIRWLDSHHRARQADILHELGVEFGEWVGENDIARAGRRVGVVVEEPVTALDVEQVRRAAETTLEQQRPTPVFATVGAVRFRVPSRHLHLIGFHEAAMRGALRMGPQQNAPMRTLPTRNRSTPTRSAADVSVKSGTPVLSPVSGTVVGVDRYALYGKYPDLRIQIVPAGDRSKLVTVLHVTGATVRVGDRVASGETVIAERATKFPFRSQIDRFAGDHPHVHVEIRNR
jgi:murein DD-endopeptidase MepM/ murein hydrolase activator NlpD